MAVGLRVAACRRAAGLTQADLAARIGTKQSSISKIESGRVTPTLPVLERIALATGSPIVITLGETPASNPDERRRRVREVLQGYEFNPWERDLTDEEEKSLLDDGLTRESFASRIATSSGRPRA
jgi:transcriptional regulator with XRE-family HTH domain